MAAAAAAEWCTVHPKASPREGSLGRREKSRQQQSEACSFLPLLQVIHPRGINQQRQAALAPPDPINWPPRHRRGTGGARSSRPRAEAARLGGVLLQGLIVAALLLLLGRAAVSGGGTRTCRETRGGQKMGSPAFYHCLCSEAHMHMHVHTASAHKARPRTRRRPWPSRTSPPPSAPPRASGTRNPAQRAQRGAAGGSRGRARPVSVAAGSGARRRAAGWAGGRRRVGGM